MLIGGNWASIYRSTFSSVVVVVVVIVVVVATHVHLIEDGGGRSASGRQQ